MCRTLLRQINLHLILDQPTSLFGGNLFVIATIKHFKSGYCAQLFNNLIKMSKTVVKKVTKTCNEDTYSQNYEGTKWNQKCFHKEPFCKRFFKNRFCRRFMRKNSKVTYQTLVILCTMNRLQK